MLDGILLQNITSSLDFVSSWKPNMKKKGLQFRGSAQSASNYPKLNPWLNMNLPPDAPAPRKTALCAGLEAKKTLYLVYPHAKKKAGVKFRPNFDFLLFLFLSNFHSWLFLSVFLPCGIQHFRSKAKGLHEYLFFWENLKRKEEKENPSFFFFLFSNFPCYCLPRKKEEVGKESDSFSSFLALRGIRSTNGLSPSTSSFFTRSGESQTSREIHPPFPWHGISPSCQPRPLRTTSSLGRGRTDVDREPGLGIIGFHSAAVFPLSPRCQIGPMKAVWNGSPRLYTQILMM